VARLIGTPIQWRPPTEPTGAASLPPAAGAPAVTTIPPGAVPPASRVE